MFEKLRQSVYLSRTLCVGGRRPCRAGGAWKVRQRGDKADEKGEGHVAVVRIYIWSFSESRFLIVVAISASVSLFVVTIFNIIITFLSILSSSLS